MTKRRHVTRSEFVRIWQRGTSLQQVARDCSLTVQSASVRASKYRARGIELKRFGGERLDVAALNAEAKKHAPKAAS